MFPRGKPPLAIFPFQKGSKIQCLKDGVKTDPHRLRRWYRILPEKWPPYSYDRKGCYE